MRVTVRLSGLLISRMAASFPAPQLHWQRDEQLRASHIGSMIGTEDILNGSKRDDEQHDSQHADRRNIDRMIDIEDILKRVEHEKTF